MQKWHQGSGSSIRFKDQVQGSGSRIRFKNQVQGSGSKAKRDHKENLTSSGIQGCRDAGLQGCRAAGLQGCRDAGMQGYIDTGIHAVSMTRQVPGIPVLVHNIYNKSKLYIMHMPCLLHIHTYTRVPTPATNWPLAEKYTSCTAYMACIQRDIKALYQLYHA